MKTILTRTLMMTLLASSLSAFAAAADGKSDPAATPSNMTQQTDCSRKANDAGNQTEQKSSDKQKIEQQDNDWLHDLQGTYGG